MKDARLVWVCKTDLGWFLPCLNWFMTNNPDKSTGIISRHLGSEQGRPKELRLWALRYGSLFAFFFFFFPWLRAIQKFCFKTASGSLLPFTCGWHWFMRKWLFCPFFFWLDFLFAQLPRWLIQLFLKATFSSLTFPCTTDSKYFKPESKSHYLWGGHHGADLSSLAFYPAWDPAKEPSKGVSWRSWSFSQAFW